MFTWVEKKKKKRILNLKTFSSVARPFETQREREVVSVLSLTVIAARERKTNGVFILFL